MYDPVAANFIRWWPVYRRGSEVIFHNQVLFLSDCDEPFDPRDPYRNVPPYSATNDEGQSISEWRIDHREIEAFAREQRG
jgi:hypothetical protein